jgi:hypothetical protein
MKTRSGSVDRVFSFGSTKGLGSEFGVSGLAGRRPLPNFSEPATGE